MRSTIRFCLLRLSRWRYLVCINQFAIPLFYIKNRLKESRSYMVSLHVDGNNYTSATLDCVRFLFNPQSPNSPDVVRSMKRASEYDGWTCIFLRSVSKCVRQLSEDDIYYTTYYFIRRRIFKEMTQLGRLMVQRACGNLVCIATYLLIRDLSTSTNFQSYSQLLIRAVTILTISSNISF